MLATGALASGSIASASPAQAAAPAQAVAATAQVQTGKGTPDKAAKAREGVAFLTECVDDNKVRAPKTFTLACADANERLENLAWTNWGGDNAFATGIVRENVSEPMSAGDKWISYPVKVKATGIVQGEASVSYTKLIVRTTGAAPKGVEALQVFDLPGVEPVKKVTNHAVPSKPANTLIDHAKGWSDGHEGMADSDGHEGMSDDPIDHLNGWSDGHDCMADADGHEGMADSDGHEGMSDDPIDHLNGWSDGHEGMADSDGHEGMSDDAGVTR